MCSNPALHGREGYPKHKQKDYGVFPEHLHLLWMESLLVSGEELVNEYRRQAESNHVKPYADHVNR